MTGCNLRVMFGFGMERVVGNTRIVSLYSFPYATRIIMSVVLFVSKIAPTRA